MSAGDSCSVWFGDMEWEPAHVRAINRDGTIRVRIIREDILIDVQPEDITCQL